VRRAAIFLGVLAGAGWFFYQLSLPALFRGFQCCDSVVYMTYARMLVRPAYQSDLLPVMSVHAPPSPASSAPAAFSGVPSAGRPSKISSLLHTLFTSTARFVPGYGFFLAFFILVSNALGGAVSWFTMVLATAFVLHVASFLFLWRSFSRNVVPLSPWVLALALAHPSLTTVAGLPLSDSLTVSLHLLAFGLFLQIFAARFSAQSALNALLMGVLFAMILWTRSIYYIAMAAFLLAWLASGALTLLLRRQASALLLALVTIASTGLLFSPRLVACYRASGTLCVLTTEDSRDIAGTLLDMGFTGARTYSLLRPIPNRLGTLITIPDPYFTRALPCTFDPDHPKQSLLLCIRRHFLQMPFFGLFKAIGFLDQPHVSPYATYITQPAVRVFLRLMMMPVIAGLFAGAWIFVTRFREFPAWNLIQLYGFLYLAALLPLAVEHRYGLLLIPIGLFGLAFLPRLRQSPRAQQCAYAVTLAAFVGLYWWRTAVWDRIDLPYVPPAVAAAKNVFNDRAELIERWHSPQRLQRD
jgi:hypothetical protein